MNWMDGWWEGREQIKDDPSAYFILCGRNSKNNLNELQNSLNSDDNYQRIENISNL